MKSSTKIVLISMSLCALFMSCNPSKSIYENTSTIEEAEKIINRQNRKKARQARKIQQEVYDEFWRKQTKAARNSIKKNERRQKQLEKQRRKSAY